MSSTSRRDSTIYELLRYWIRARPRRSGTWCPMFDFLFRNIYIYMYIFNLLLLACYLLLYPENESTWSLIECLALLLEDSKTRTSTSNNKFERLTLVWKLKDHFHKFQFYELAETEQYVIALLELLLLFFFFFGNTNPKGKIHCMGKRKTLKEHRPQGPAQ